MKVLYFTLFLLKISYNFTFSYRLFYHRVFCMSFSCPFDEAGYAGAGYIPCKQDLVVGILRKLLGDSYVNAFLISGESPALAVLAKPTALSMTLSLLASVAITAAILIFIISIYKWVTESANDGEAVGLSERGGILGMFGRPFFALALLVPTASGYPTINLIIMTVVLWANGATNQLYKTVSESKIGVLTINSAFVTSDVFTMANDVTDAYVTGATQGYCLAMLLEGGSTDLKASASNISNQYSTPSPERLVTYYDTTGYFTAKSRPVCGTFKIEKFTDQSIVSAATNKLGKSEVFDWIHVIQFTQATPTKYIVNLRGEYAALAYLQGMNESLGSTDLAKVYGLSAMSTSALSGKILGNNGNTAVTRGSIPLAAGWNRKMTEAELQNPVDIKTLMANAKLTSDKLQKEAAEAIQTMIVTNGSYAKNISDASKAIQRLLLSTGWMNAGNAQATLRQLRGGATNKIGHKPYQLTSALGFSPEEVAEQDGIKSTTANAILTAGDVINQGVYEALPKGHPAQISLASQVLQAELDSGGNGGKSADNMASTLAAPYHSLNETVISIIVDPNSPDDTLTRIQNVGEWMLLLIGMTLTAIIAIKVVLVGLQILAALISGFTFGVAKGGEKAADTSAQLINDILLSPLEELMDTFFLLSRIFGVVIPSMPYIFLILAGIGWFVQIVQTMFGMPLWLIMHSIPDKSFIGSQQQGYVTLLSMLFRPILIMSGFYVAFELYDPLVIYATQAFFDSYGTISGATSSNSVSEFMIYFGSLKYWYFLYAGVLMAITYLVFGLVQELSDSVLDWLGTNLLRGFGNMDSKSTVQGVAGAMTNSSKAGRQAFKERRRASLEKQGSGKSPDDPRTQEEQKAADDAVKAVRASKDESSGSGAAAAGAASAAAVVRNGDSSVTDDTAPVSGSPVNDDNLTAEKKTNDSSESGSIVDTDDDRSLSSGGDDNNAANLEDSYNDSQGVLGSAGNDSGDDVTDTAFDSNDAAQAFTGGSGGGGSDGAGGSGIGSGSGGGSGGGSSGSGGGGSSVSGGGLGINIPSAGSNAKLAAIAAGSGFLAGSALASRAGGLAGKEGGSKGTFTHGADGKFTATGLGKNGDISARGTVTDSGYNANLTQTRDGVEVPIGSESVTTSDSGMVTSLRTQENADTSRIVTDADNNVVSTTDVVGMGDGVTQTTITTPALDQTTVMTEHADGNVSYQDSVTSTGQVTRTDELDHANQTQTTVEFAPSGANGEATAMSSEITDNKNDTVTRSSFDPQSQTTMTTTQSLDRSGAVLAGSAVTTTMRNSAITPQGGTVPRIPKAPFWNGNPPPPAGNTTGGGNTPPPPPPSGGTTGGGNTPPPPPAGGSSVSGGGAPISAGDNNSSATGSTESNITAVAGAAVAGAALGAAINNSDQQSAATTSPNQTVSNQSASQSVSGTSQIATPSDNRASVGNNAVFTPTSNTVPSTRQAASVASSTADQSVSGTPQVSTPSTAQATSSPNTAPNLGSTANPTVQAAGVAGFAAAQSVSGTPQVSTPSTAQSSGNTFRPTSNVGSTASTPPRSQGASNVVPLPSARVGGSLAPNRSLTAALASTAASNAAINGGSQQRPTSNNVQSINTAPTRLSNAVGNNAVFTPVARPAAIASSQSVSGTSQISQPSAVPMAVGASFASQSTGGYSTGGTPPTQAQFSQPSTQGVSVTSPPSTPMQSQQYSPVSNPTAVVTPIRSTGSVTSAAPLQNTAAPQAQARPIQSRNSSGAQQRVFTPTSNKVASVKQPTTTRPAQQQQPRANNPIPTVRQAQTSNVLNSKVQPSESTGNPVRQGSRLGTRMASNSSNWQQNTPYMPQSISTNSFNVSDSGSRTFTPPQPIIQGLNEDDEDSIISNKKTKKPTTPPPE